jgi:ribosomal protein S18 acetylase RimI-like enzyme
MPKQVTVRSATSNDIPYLVDIDHGYGTDHVWQMAYSRMSGETRIAFREVRLPRPMRVAYPRDPRRLIDEWLDRSGMFIAEQEGHPVGYVAFVDGPAPDMAWITDLVVGLSDRRQGIGSRLLQTALGWCRERGLNKVFLEMQSKNYPAICLARKLGMAFAGYSDSYYPDEDIALFFSIDVRADLTD